ncbi:MAG: 3-isopropylmalate dehydratase large subunit, partial [Okeania sp. SIO1H5]|uniref:aconitase family protein n=1 Tax=Okeania sp. SIO1H5 TaxID=2607777 RepID=UPI0013B8F909
IGYVNPDQTTFEYIKGREYAPKESDWQEAVSYWKSIASDPDATYDDVVHIDGDRLEPQITWGITPGQAIDISQNMPSIDEVPAVDRPSIEEAFAHMGFQAGETLKGKKIDVVFIGSCTNSRISDLREVARLMEGKRVAPDIQAIVVPGSQRVQRQAESEGIDRILREAGFEWREAGCSMCLAMNPDKLQARQLCASTSNRNFKGRQGSPTGRTLLMSPAMAAAAAVEGVVADAREVFAL